MGWRGEIRVKLGRNGILKFRSVEPMCLKIWEQFCLQKEAAASLPLIALTCPILYGDPVSRRSHLSAIQPTCSKLLEPVWPDRSESMK